MLPTDKFKIRELDLETINPSTKNAFNKTQGGEKTIVIGKPGTGKCLAAGTELLTYDGQIVKIEDVKVGDLLMGDDSKPRTVLSTCSGQDKLYRIVQNCGIEYVVNEPHILSLRNVYSGYIEDVSVCTYLDYTDTWKNMHRGYAVPVEFKHKNVTADPYYVGCSLAGFLFNEAAAVEDDEEEQVEYGYRVPRDYLVNSRRIRLEVLAGIIDADVINHIQTEELQRDVLFLCHTLGFRTRVCTAVNSLENIVEYRITIFGDLTVIPTNLTTLHERWHDEEASFSENSTHISVESAGEGTYFGFELDGNKRFLLSDCTVTHNTTLIASLLYSKKHIIPVGVACSGSEDSNHYYRNIFPSTFVYNEYNEEAITKLIRRQKIAKEHLPNPWAVLLLDDCTDDPKVFNKPLQHALFKKGRHWNLWYILSLQYAIDVKPVIRVNVDGVFILREMSLRIRRVIWENYASIIPDFTQFCDIMDFITDDYTALYIRNAHTSNKVEDCVFYYKATPVPSNFRFGADDVWDFHNARYNEDYVEPYV